MGRLIKTGGDREGHSTDFEYVGEAEAKKCFLNCSCGWSTEIEQFRHPWSLIEIKVKINKHFAEVGVKLIG